MKPLYLLHPELEVQLDAGPSLVVRAPQRAEQRFPLMRVSRLVCDPRVRIETAALMACADAGLLVTFVDSGGGLRACLMSHPGRRRRLAARVRDFKERPDWQERFFDWVSAMESLGRRRVLGRLGMAGDAVAPWRLRALLRERIDERLTAALRPAVWGLLQGCLESLAADAVAGTGITPADAIWLEEALGLNSVLADILWWDLCLPLLDLLGAPDEEPLHQIERSTLVMFFEDRAPYLYRWARYLVERLMRRMAELVP